MFHNSKSSTTKLAMLRGGRVLKQVLKANTQRSFSTSTQQHQQKVNQQKPQKQRVPNIHQQNIDEEPIE